MTDDDHRPATATPAAPVDGTIRPGRPDAAEVVAFVAAVAVATVAVLVGTVLLVFLSPSERIAAGVLGILGLGLLVMPPLALGAALAAWDVSPGEVGRRRHARLLRSMLAAQAGGAVLVVLSAQVGGSLAWLPASFIALGAASTVAGLVVGSSLADRARRRAPDPTAQVGPRPLSRADVRRGVRTVALTFALTFVPVAVALSFVPTGGDQGSADMLFAAAGLAFIAASVACLVLSFRLQRQLTTILGRDPESARRIIRAVGSRRSVELGPDDERRAARWASVSAVSLPVQYVQTALLFAGLVCQQLPRALGPDGGVFARAFVVGVAVMAVGFAPFFFTRAARARRFAASRRHLLSPPSPDDAAGTAGPTGDRPSRRRRR